MGNADERGLGGWARIWILQEGAEEAEKILSHGQTRIRTDKNARDLFRKPNPLRKLIRVSSVFNPWQIQILCYLCFLL